MISEFSVSPKPQNNNAKLFALLSLLTGTLIVITSMMLEEYRGLVAAFSLVPFTLMILIYTKYISSKFVYDVFIDTDGEPLFIVRQVTGKKSVTLCRVELASIVKVEYETKAERKQKRADKETARYLYCPTLFPETTIRLSLIGYRAKSEVIIEGNSEFSSLLEGYAKEARESKKSDAE